MRSVRSVHQSLIRVKVFVTKASMLSVRKVRLVRAARSNKRRELLWLKSLTRLRQEQKDIRESAIRSTEQLIVLASTYSSSKHIYAQVIDDVNGVTLCSASSMSKDFEGNGGNKEGARKVGEMIAQAAKAKGIENVVFDRGGYLYHGRVQELADGAREGGLKF